MEQTLVIVSIEVLLVALTAIGAMLFVNWRRTTRCHAALERLFEDVKERQTIRHDRIIACLTSHYKLDESVAEELSASLFAAEKLFLTQFIEQQMREQSVDGFYQNLCDLLDRYLNEIPARVIDRVDNLAAGKLNKPEEIKAQGGNKDQDDVDKTPPPDWGDVFD